MHTNDLPWFLQRDSHLIYTKPKKGYLVLDFETDTLDKGSPLNTDNHLVLACWQIVDSTGAVIRKHKFGSEYEMYELLEDIAKVDFVVAQNAKFELGWLKRCGAELRDFLIYDTLLAAWVLDGNRQNSRDLDSLARKYNLPTKLDLVKRLITVGWEVRSIPKPWLLQYCHQDVEVTRLVFLEQLKELGVSNLFHIAHCRNLTCSVLADIEFEGMTLDAAAVLKEYDRVAQEHALAKEKLEELSEGINLNSGKQLAEFLYGKLGFAELKERGEVLKTGAGAPRTDADTLLKLDCYTDEQRDFLDTYRKYNKLNSALSKYLVFFKGVVEEKGGRFYGVFNQNITETHRLSSSGRSILFKGQKKPKGAQFQNLPREYKKLFWSGDDDWLIGESDAAQLEFRVAADLGRDVLARDEIINWFDVHSVTAKTLADAGEEEMQGKSKKEQRQLAKKSTFAPLYGGMGKTKAQKAYCEFFKKKYNAIARTQVDWVHKVAAEKRLVTPYGLIFYWPNAKANSRGYVNCSTEVHNYPVQGFATAEIIPIALVHFWHRIRGLDIRIINTVHDSIICVVKKGNEDIYHDICKQSMTFDVFRFLDEIYGYEFKVPLGVGIKLSRNWGNTDEEVTYNCFRDRSSQRKE